ncbi:MAG TPA: GIY-YIG nuclease family protein [Sediminibacterium sp.]|nr:GIY-YIG nuclease family protein [Sediminibacterium sp.]
MTNRKDLIHAYKEKKPRMGLFQIRNTINGKILLQASPNLDTVWNRERFQLKNGTHLNQALQKEWNEYGEEHFVYEIVSELKQEGSAIDYRYELKQLQKLFLEEHQPYGERGYNFQKNNNS